SRSSRERTRSGTPAPARTTTPTRRAILFAHGTSPAAATDRMPAPRDRSRCGERSRRSVAACRSRARGSTPASWLLRAAEVEEVARRVEQRLAAAGVEQIAHVHDELVILVLHDPIETHVAAAVFGHPRAVDEMQPTPIAARFLGRQNYRRLSNARR